MSTGVDNILLTFQHKDLPREQPPAWRDSSFRVDWVCTYDTTLVDIRVETPSFVCFKIEPIRDQFNGNPTLIECGPFPFNDRLAIAPLSYRRRIPLQVYFNADLTITVSTIVPPGEQSRKVSFKFMLANWRNRGDLNNWAPVYDIRSPNATIHDLYDFSHLMIKGPADLTLRPIYL
jgi:hypothetical protein